MDGANWDDFFMPKFSKSVDGLIRDLKLGIDEAVVVTTLIGDGLRYYVALISKESLQKYGLSDLDDKGIITPPPPFVFVFIFAFFLTCFLFYLFF